MTSEQPYLRWMEEERKGKVEDVTRLGGGVSRWMTKTGPVRNREQLEPGRSRTAITRRAGRQPLPHAAINAARGKRAVERAG